MLSLLVAAALLFSLSLLLLLHPPHLLEDVVDERVEDRHGLGRDAGVGVHLLQDLVDVDGVGLLPPLLALLLVTLGDGFLGLARLLGGLSGGLGRHVDAVGADN